MRRINTVGWRLKMKNESDGKMKINFLKIKYSPVEGLDVAQLVDACLLDIKS